MSLVSSLRRDRRRSCRRLLLGLAFGGLQTRSGSDRGESRSFTGLPGQPSPGQDQLRGHPRLYARVLGPGRGRHRAYRPGVLRASCYENCYEGQMSAARMPAFPLVRYAAADRNRTDEPFITRSFRVLPLPAAA
jgi:hypothetical protein